MSRASAAMGDGALRRRRLRRLPRRSRQRARRHRPHLLLGERPGAAGQRSPHNEAGIERDPPRALRRAGHPRRRRRRTGRRGRRASAVGRARRRQAGARVQRGRLALSGDGPGRDPGGDGPGHRPARRDAGLPARARHCAGKSTSACRSWRTTRRSCPGSSASGRGTLGFGAPDGDAFFRALPRPDAPGQPFRPPNGRWTTRSGCSCATDDGPLRDRGHGRRPRATGRCWRG